MRYLKKYNEELHLNPLQIGKKKWNMPGGLSLYSHKKRISSSEFEEFMTQSETLKKYFPLYGNRLEIIDPYEIPFDLDRQDQISYRDIGLEYIWFKVSNHKGFLGKVNPSTGTTQANPRPDGTFLGSDFEVTNYLIVECDTYDFNNNGKDNSAKLSIRWFQTFKCKQLNVLPYDHILKPKEKSNIKYRNYLYSAVDISIGDEVFDQDDLDWNQIKEDVLQEEEKKSKKKETEAEAHERTRKGREPFFQELQDTLFDLTLNISDLLFGEVEIERANIINYSDILSLHSNSIKNNDVDLLFELSKELKQLDVNLKNMDFHQGKLSDYVTLDFSLETGKYSHNGDLDIYFHWSDKKLV